MDRKTPMISIARFPNLKTKITDFIFPSKVCSTDLDSLRCYMTTHVVTECFTPIPPKYDFFTGGILQ